MYRKTLKIRDISTEIISCTSWTDNEKNTQDKEEDIIIIITGNPGVPEFYEEFALSVQNSLLRELPLWIIGHTGHTKPPDNVSHYYPDITQTNLYDLKANLDHKAEFIKKYVPLNAKIHLIGHSIGSWFVLNLLKDNDIADRIKKCYLLFPTIERMRQSPNGWFLTNVILRIAPIILLFFRIFSLFPHILQEFLVKIFGLFYGFSTQSQINAVLQTIHPISLERILFLAKQEMIFVKELDNDLISQHKNKLFLYYGSRDGWTPIRYYEDFKINHPNVNAQLCNRGFQHSFVLKDSVEVGKMIGNLINESL